MHFLFRCSPNPGSGLEPQVAADSYRKPGRLAGDIRRNGQAEQREGKPSGDAQPVTWILPLSRQHKPQVIEDHRDQGKPFHPIERVIALGLDPLLDANKVSP